LAGEEIQAAGQNEATEEPTEAQSPHRGPSKPTTPEPLVENSSESHLIAQIRSGEKRPLESDVESNSMSPIPTAKIMPTLRLNVALASDPATNPEAKELRNIHVKTEDNKSEDDEVMSNHDDAESIIDAVNLNNAALNAAQQQHLLAAPKSKENVNNINQLMVKNLEMLPRPNVFMCTPCNIRFSSLSTLEAHQTYYCSHRKDADGNPMKEGAVNDPTNGGEPPTKSIKTGKQYACTQCSYSADKKVSLNRHMRMHQTSPAPSSTTSNGEDASSQIVVQQIIGPPQPIVVDRYCSNCDIRFSSTKTYRAHKQHYCSSRHRDE
jgi:zinc finger protein ZFPM1